MLVEVLEEGELCNPAEVEIIVHSKNRDEIYKALMKSGRNIPINFIQARYQRKAISISSFYK